MSLPACRYGGGLLIQSTADLCAVHLSVSLHADISREDKFDVQSALQVLADVVHPTDGCNVYMCLLCAYPCIIQSVVVAPQQGCTAVQYLVRHSEAHH